MWIKHFVKWMLIILINIPMIGIATTIIFFAPNVSNIDIFFLSVLAIGVVFSTTIVANQYYNWKFNIEK